MLVGEIQTGLLRHSVAASPATAISVLGLKPGAQVAFGDRPARFARSPQLLTGVDCLWASGPAPRCVGTVATSLQLNGGQVLQGSSHSLLVQATASRRLPWSHYLAEPGVLEVIGRLRPSQKFLDAQPSPSHLDLGAINAKWIRLVQREPTLDQRFAFRAPPTRLRWMALQSAADSIVFVVRRGAMRTVRLESTMDDRHDLVGLCEDIALHDWLLTTVLSLLERSRIGEASRREVVTALAPALDCLLHLWMPGARLLERARSLWDELEMTSSITRQWRASIDRIRDQLALATATTLGP